MTMENGHRPEATAAAGPTRRGLLEALLGAGFLAWIGSIVFPVIRYLSPLEESGGADQVTLEDKQKKDLDGAGFVQDHGFALSTPGPQVQNDGRARRIFGDEHQQLTGITVQQG